MKKILYDSEYDQDLYDYGCIVLKQYTQCFFITSILCVLLRCLPEFLYLNTLIIPLRRTLGGFHFADKNKCLTGSVILGVTISFGSIYAAHYISPLAIFLLFGLFITLSLHNGCIDHPNKPLSSNEKNYYLKKGIAVEIKLFVITLFLSYYGYHSLVAISIFSIGFCTLGNSLVKYCHLNTKSNHISRFLTS